MVSFNDDDDDNFPFDPKEYENMMNYINNMVNKVNKRKR